MLPFLRRAILLHLSVRQSSFLSAWTQWTQMDTNGHLVCMSISESASMFLFLLQSFISIYQGIQFREGTYIS